MLESILARPTSSPAPSCHCITDVEPFGTAADAALDNPAPKAGHQPAGCRRAAGAVPADADAAVETGRGSVVERAGSCGAGDHKPLCGCRSEEAETCGARSCGDKIFPGRRPELLAVSASSRTPVEESTVRAVVCAEVLASTPLLNLRAGVERFGLPAPSGVAAGAKRL